MFNIIRADRPWQALRFDAELLAWRDAVVSIGGAAWRPSLQEMTRKNRLIHEHKQSGAWELIDDIWDGAAENELQALVTLKRRLLCVAHNDVQFLAGVGWVFDGYAHFIEWPFVPALHGRAMTATNQRLAALCLTNQPANDFALGSTDAVPVHHTLRPGSATTMSANLNAPAVVTFGLGAAPVDHSGWCVASRSLPDTMLGYKNGVRLADATGLALAPGLSGYSFFIGANNLAGASVQRTYSWTGAYAELGGQLSDRQEQAAYRSVRALAASRDVRI